MRRLEMGLSQEKLGQKLGLTFQQVQKYEKGTNRVGSGRLHEIGRILGVPVSYFFEGIEGSASEESTNASTGYYRYHLESLLLLQAFNAIPNARMRRALVQTALAMTGQTEKESAEDPHPQKAFSHNS
jgi:transcriptional regulator with XRE-family HTH domain